MAYSRFDKGQGPLVCLRQNTAMDPSRRFLFRRSSVAAQAKVQRPPGALLEAVFVETCTRCDACIDACPADIIRRGDGGFPEMNFKARGCDACGVCLPVCKPKALQAPLSFGEWRAELGSTCLALRGVECRVCGEACDARAIRFKPLLGGVSQPVLDASSCTGCGACVGGCPTQAISMCRG